ncbi:unnamed protein product [Cuscuta campestris]|uniref:Dof zinc finger protein n=1 Tax=Cuscuta campestris TaxID=132261 RepID=A0A484KKY7_9ASTE|nr:unnamed protein product [Cuscuta campestris]
MVFSSIQTYLDPSNWQPQQLNHQHHLGESGTIPTPHLPLPTPPEAAQANASGVGGGGIRPNSMAERARLANIQIPDAALKCPRCESTNTKFCYFNNYSLSQPRHFCKTCKRYWTRGGALRSVPVGGGCRRNNKRSSKGGGGGGSSNSSCSKSTTTTSSVGNDQQSNISCGGPSMSSAASAVILAPQIHHHLPFTAQVSDHHRYPGISHPPVDAGENMMMTLHLGGGGGGENYNNLLSGGVAPLLSSAGGIQQPPSQFSFFDPLFNFHQAGFELSLPSGFTGGAGFRPRVPPSTFVQPATAAPVKTEDGDNCYRNYHNNMMMVSNNPNNNNVGVGLNSIVINSTGNNEQWCNWSDINSASFSSSSTSDNHL